MEITRSYNNKEIRIIREDESFFLKAYDVALALNIKNIYQLIKNCEKKKFYAIFLTEKGAIQFANKLRKHSEFITWLFDIAVELRTERHKRRADIIEEFSQFEPGDSYCFIFQDQYYLRVNYTDDIRSASKELLEENGKIVYYKMCKNTELVANIVTQLLKEDVDEKGDYIVNLEYAKKCVDIAIALQYPELIDRIHNVCL